MTLYIRLLSSKRMPPEFRPWTGAVLPGKRQSRVKIRHFGRFAQRSLSGLCVWERSLVRIPLPTDFPGRQKAYKDYAPAIKILIAFSGQIRNHHTAQRVGRCGDFRLGPSCCQNGKSSFSTCVRIKISTFRWKST